MKKIRTLKLHDGRKAEIFFNDEYEEYCVKFYSSDKYLINADYFTDDQDDAYSTAIV